MDMQMVQTVIDWVQQNVGDRISKQELVSKAQGSNLPQEATSAFQQLPDGLHSKESIVSTIKDKLMAGVGSATGGMGGMGGMGGSGGMGGGMGSGMGGGQSGDTGY